MSDLSTFIHADDRESFKKFLQAFLEHPLRRSVEFRLQPLQGVEYWICLTLYPLPDKKQLTTVLGMAQNITRQKNYEQNLLKYNASKDSVLEIVAHDLRAPLATVEGIASLLEQKLPTESDKHISQLLGVIHQTCRRATELIRQLVNREFLESSQVELNRTRLDLVAKLREVLSEYGQVGQNLDRQISLEASQEPIYIAADEMKLMQVINNLISNALKFTPPQGQIRLRVEDRGNLIRLEVRDDGIGIPAHYHGSLFDNFTKARRPGLQGEQPIGLGMSIIKRIIEMHGGIIWLESQKGVGTFFY